ncbi:hypothetical protein AX15_004655 [Amanita polypyramis BW_CC]|nr:hypothetical protein AX15_004655 [Amanita polypyramis BW_CC]
MLSYSQVDRILRPLRNKCNAFATLALKSTPNLPPLSVLPPPDINAIRVHFDKHRVNTLELSRKIYAVRDCFRDVLVKILGRSASKNIGQTTQARVLGLADLCAMTVGSTLHMESSQSEEGAEDPATELLESIPLQYRRKAIIAHSLEVVLQLCPHHPTLLHLLLDVTLKYDLENESYVLLRALFTVACNKDTTSNPPICYPAHRTYLVDICKYWTSFSLTTQGFTRVLLEVVRTAADPTPIWTCNAFATLMPNLAKNDMTSFVTCVDELLGSLSKIDFSSTTLEQRQPLLAALGVAYRHLLSQDHDQDMDWIPVLLRHLGSLTVPTKQAGSVDIVLDAISALICLATHWLSKRPPESMLHQSAQVEYLLDNNKPRPTTYNVILSPIAASGDLQKLKESVQLYTITLRSHGLLHHEASLWACALRQAESPAVEQMLSIHSDAKSVKTFCLELIDQVEEAERRCFGRQRLPLSLKDDNACGTRRRRSSDGTWCWDATFQCWYRAQDDEPSLKKLKKDSGRSYSTRYSCPTLPVIHSKSLPECGTMESESDSSPTGLQSESPGTNFATLLCRAILNRTVLHPKRRSEDRVDSSPPEWTMRTMPLADMDSDDALNLFL